MSTTEKLRSPGARLKWVRKQLNRSQREMGDALNLSLTGYQNYERDAREIPVEVMGRLHSRLGVLPVWLLNGTGEPWIDEVHTPEHLRAPSKPVPDEAAKLASARLRVGAMLEDYPDLKGIRAVEVALLNVAAVPGIGAEHLYLLGAAFNEVCRSKTPAKANAVTQQFNAGVQQVAARDVVNKGRKK